MSATKNHHHDSSSREGFGQGLASNLGICTLAGTISAYVPRLERPRRYDPGRNNLGMFWISKPRIFRSIRNSFSSVGFSYSWKTSKRILISFKFELVSYSWGEVPSIFIWPFGRRQHTTLRLIFFERSSDSLWFFEELLEHIGISRGVRLHLSNGVPPPFVASSLCRGSCLS